MAEGNVKLTIEAENRARAAVNEFARDVRQGTQVLDAMAGEIIGRLNPAIDGAIRSISLAAREAKGLPIAFGAATVGIAAAATAIGFYIQRMTEAEQTTANLQRAVARADMSAVRSEFDKAADTVRKYDERVRTTLSEQASFLDATLAKIAATFSHMTGEVNAARATLEQSAAAMRIVWDSFISPDRTAQIVAQFQEIRQAQLQFAQGFATTANELERAQAGQLDAITRRAEAQIQSLRAQREREAKEFETNAEQARSSRVGRINEEIATLRAQPDLPGQPELNAARARRVSELEADRALTLTGSGDRIAAEIRRMLDQEIASVLERATLSRAQVQASAPEMMSRIVRSRAALEANIVGEDAAARGELTRINLTGAQQARDILNTVDARQIGFPAAAEPFLKFMKPEEAEALKTGLTRGELSPAIAESLQRAINASRDWTEQLTRNLLLIDEIEQEVERMTAAVAGGLAREMQNELTRERDLRQANLDLQRDEIAAAQEFGQVGFSAAAAARIELHRTAIKGLADEIDRLRDIQKQQAAAGDLEGVRATEGRIGILGTEIRRGELNISVEQRRELERTNAGLGLARGFQEAAEAAESSGAIMREVAHRTATDMQRTFSDVFFNAVTGQFKKLEDAPKAFAQALLRTLTDATAQAVTAPIFRFFGGSVSSPFSGSGAVAAPVDVSNAPTSVLAGLQQQGYQLVSGAGGQTYAVPAAAGGYGFAGTGTGASVTAALNQIRIPAPASFGGTPTVTAGGVNYSGADAGYAAAELGAIGANFQTSTTVGVGQVGGVALSVLGAAASAYSIYEAGSRGTNPDSATTSAAIGGAVSAISTGTQIASLAGGLVGGLAGFGVFAVTAILGHFASKEAAARRDRLLARQARKQQAQDVVNQMLSTVNDVSLSARSMLGRPIYLHANVPSGRTVLDPRRGPITEYATREVPGPSTGGLLLRMAELRGNGELISFLQERGIGSEGINIQQGLVAGGVQLSQPTGWLNSAEELAATIDNVDAFLDDMLRGLQAAAERDALEDAAPFGYVVKGGGITGTEYLASAYLERGIPESGTRDLFVSRQYLREVLGYDENLINRVVNRISAHTARRDPITDVTKSRFFEGFG